MFAFCVLAISAAFVSCSIPRNEPEMPISPKEPEHIVWGDTTSRVFTVSLSAETKVGYNHEHGYRWQAGDILIVSNCNSDVILDNGTIAENANACLVSITENMISANGTTVSFPTTIPSAPRYCIVAASKAKSIVSVSKNGVVTTGKLQANANGVLPYIGSCTGEGNSFILETDVPIACFTVTAMPVYNITITQGSNNQSVYVTQHPCVVYFHLEDVSVVAVKASSVTSSLFTHLFKDVSVPKDGSVLDLGDLCALAGHSDMFDRWKAGLPFKVAGKTLDKASWGDAVHVKHDTLVHNAEGVFFIDKDVVLTVSETGGKRFAAFSNEEGAPASVDIRMRLSGNVAFKDIRFEGKAQKMFGLWSPADYVLFQNCSFQGSKFLSSSADIKILRFEDCTFYSKTASELDLVDIKESSISELLMKGNIFYNKIPEKTAFVSSKSINSLIIQDNILYLDKTAGKYFCMVDGNPSSVLVSGNLACGAGCDIAIPDAIPGEEFSGPVTDPFTRKDFDKGIFEYNLSQAVDKNLITQLLECSTPEATFCLENEKVHGFVNDFEYDTDYSYTKISDYTGDEGNWQAPLPVALTLETSIPFNQQFVLTITTDGEQSVTYGGSSPTVEIYNLTPGKTYSYGIISATDGRLLRKGAFETTGTVRQIKTVRVRNVRDVGGWSGIGGKKVKYGILYRGAEFKNNSADLKAVEQDDYKVFVNNLGISLDLDLRGNNERGGIDWSPLGISYLHLPLSPYLWAVQDPNRALYAQGIRALIENARNSEATYVHCQAGADRTGTFVFLVNGLLGVSESDLAKDYEITSYYSDRSRNSDNYKALINSILAFCKESRDINEGIYNAVLSMGISEQEIEELRTLMLE